jgi:hypothetical protein
MNSPSLQKERRQRGQRQGWKEVTGGYYDYYYYNYYYYTHTFSEYRLL